MVQFDPIRAAQAGRESANALFDTYARSRAGSQMAGGNAAEAANTLARFGMIEDASALQQRQAQVAQAERASRVAEEEDDAKWLTQGAQGLLQVPYEQRRSVYQAQIRPRLESRLSPEDMARVDAADLSDAELRAIVTSYGGTVSDPRGSAPSGYAWGQGNQLEAIPGGPADPSNQRWQVTPYGLLPPPGWSPEQGAGSSAPQGQPTTLGSTLPPGWTVERPNAAPSVRSSGGAEMSQQATAGFANTDEARTAIASIVPGVRFTSGTRSEADNRRVGGVPTSNHRRGRAWDLVPPSGMTMAQLAQTMRAQGLRALNEGDHVHVSW